MKMTIQVVIEDDDTTSQAVQKVISLERNALDLGPSTLGLTLDEGKEILAGVQTVLVTAQITRFIESQRSCPDCGAAYVKNGTHQLTFRTLFGTMKLASQRFFTCPCQKARITALGQKDKTQQQKKPQMSFSPLANLLPERTSPEFLYFQTKWVAVMSYERTAEFLLEAFPLEKPISTAVLSQHVEQVATRIDGELGDEQSSFIEGCPADWEELPEPAEPIVMGIDGGYVHAQEGENRKAGSFEIIVGKSMGGGKPLKRFGFVNTYDTKPKRRVYEVLKSQGMQMNQQVIFLSDGGDDVRNLQLYLNPYAEHLLDWFHITMRLTVLGQLARSVALRTLDMKETQPPFEEEEEPLPSVPTLEELERQLERMKWYLWHGNVFCALQIGEDLEDDLEVLEERDVSIQKMYQAVREFNGYIAANESFVVNYGDRYRNGEIISTAFVESTVNEVVSKRFVKKQQMRWTKKGAHNLLQVRIQVLNGDLRQTFHNWYAGMQKNPNFIEYDKAA
jgi:hypothetical protein